MSSLRVALGPPRDDEEEADDDDDDEDYDDGHDHDDADEGDDEDELEVDDATKRGGHGTSPNGTSISASSEGAALMRAMHDVNHNVPPTQDRPCSWQCCLVCLGFLGLHIMRAMMYNNTIKRCYTKSLALQGPGVSRRCLAEVLALYRQAAGRLQHHFEDSLGRPRY